MKKTQAKNVSLALIAIAAVTAIFFSATPNTAFAQIAKNYDGFTVIQGDELQSSTAKTMLERIEIMKQRIAEMQNKQKQQTEQEKFIEEQRRIAKQHLDAELTGMERKYQDFTPKNAFERFVSKTPENTHGVFWGMFEYQHSKVKHAQDTMKEILSNGGTYQEARDAYHKIVETKRTDLAEVTKNLNIENGLAETNVQNTFDEFGKLPRTED